ncbi:hypothetical protein [Streptomyces daliensis]|uniref:MinD-like ATPase involved in chromosome partitioning or flagellar assembly n=1 Tax=Streptomyces daliensis TaxID=299421 RepID=A0A8T4J3I0_9ACTN|nr:hypothetical protein [Streptomyces daliensis]
MTLVAVCSVKGSPGVTTACVALGARWPEAEHPVVVEVDPAGGDLLARWRLAMSPGLVSLAAASRRTAEPGLVWQHTQRLPGGLPVVAGPVGATQARAALGALAGSPVPVLREAANRVGTVVIADCGRADPDSAALPVMRAADVTLLLARACDDSLSHIAVRLEEAARWSRKTCFVLVGDGYPTAEVARELGTEVLGRIPEDAKGAAACNGRPGRSTAPVRSAVGRAVADLAALVSWHARGEPDAHRGPYAYRLAPPPPDIDPPVWWRDTPAPASTSRSGVER